MQAVKTQWHRFCSLFSKTSRDVNDFVLDIREYNAYLKKIALEKNAI